MSVEEEEEKEDEKREKIEEETGRRDSMEGKRREMSQQINYLRKDKDKDQDLDVGGQQNTGIVMVQWGWVE